MKRKNMCLPDRIIEAIDKEAKEKGVAFADIVRRVLDAYIDQKKDENNKNN